MAVREIDGVGTALVTVLIGPDKQALTVDRAILCKGADFFHKALNEEFKEAKTSTLELPEDDPTSFRIFLLWAAGGSCEYHLPKWNGIGVYDVLKAFHFSEKYTIESLQTICYKALTVDDMLESIPRDSFYKAWAVVKDSIIRFAVIVEYWRSLNCSLDASDRIRDESDVDFLRDVLVCRTLVDNESHDYRSWEFDFPKFLEMSKS